MEPKVNIEEGWKILEDLTTNADQFQQKVLEEILSKNAGTEYLKRFLDGHADKELFKKKVPITNYDDLKPYIERIVVKGEPSDILLAEPITGITLSSGTSRGQAKMMPLTNKQLDQLTYCRSIALSVASKFVDGLEKGKQMQLFFVRPDIYVPSGLPARPILSSYHKSKNFEKYESSLYTSPLSTILCLDSKQSIYCQFLCGLLQRDEVVCIGAVFASVLFRAIRFLEDHWRELCSNLRTGHLSDWITDTGCKNALSLMLTNPNPEQADLIEDACNSKSWEGIIRKLWPKAKNIDVIATGSMAQYLPSLEFYCGGLPIVSLPYASSESFLGINLKPLCKPSDVSYTLVPDVAYFEFLPVMDHEQVTKEAYSNTGSNEGLTQKQNKEEAIEPVELVNVKLGQCYELVITTFTGLNRYKIGDVLRVTGFHNNAPQFQFVRKQDVVLSVDVEKTSEDELLEAMTRAKLLLEPFQIALADYTSYADVSTLPGHYVLFWELKNIEGSGDFPELNPMIIEQCCSSVEESLNYLYKNCRKGNTVGPLEIRVVEQGTFDSLMDFYISKGSSISQYKTPRCIKLEEAFKILDSRVVGRYFSQKVPA